MPLPKIYAMEELMVEDRMEVYADQILGNARCSQVESALVAFVAENIEPIGWQAVWKSNPKSSGLRHSQNFLVLVLDVSQTKLEAKVELLHALPPEEVVGSKQQEVDEEEVETFLKQDTGTVPLLELGVVLDDAADTQFVRTAEVIEHVRFFYDYVWRPWDCDDDDDCIFSAVYLEDRLKLHEAMCSGVIPESVTAKVESILEEGRRIQEQLEELEEQMGASDPEVELGEREVLRCMQLRSRQEELKRQLGFLENPTLRALVIRQGLRVKAAAKGKREGEEEPTVIHIVAAKLFVWMLQDLAPSSVVEHHVTLSSAVSSTYEGDTIWIFPGEYLCEGLGWLEDSVNIEGKGSRPEDVVLVADVCTDVFLNCSAHHIRLSNVSLRVSPSHYCALMVHSGQLDMRGCVVSGGQVGVAVHSTSQVCLQDCEISNAAVCGFNVHSTALLTMDDCIVRHAVNFGLVIEFEENLETEEEEEEHPVKIRGSRFEGNGKGDIAFYPLDKDVRELRSGEFRVLEHENDKFCQKILLEDTTFDLQDDIHNMSILV